MMTESRKWSAGAVVLIAAIVAAGWFLLVSPKRTEAADLKTQTATQDATNVTLEQKLQELKAQQADLPAQRARLAEIQHAVPGNPGLPSLIRDLTAASSKVGVTIDAMMPAAPAAVTTAASAVVAQPDPAAAAAAGPVLYQVPLSLNVSGSYFELEQFVQQLEGLQRAFLVTGFSMAPKPSEEAPDDLGLTVAGRVYMSKDPAPAAVPATPVAPATSN